MPPAPNIKLFQTSPVKTLPRVLPAPAVEGQSSIIKGVDEVELRPSSKHVYELTDELRFNEFSGESPCVSMYDYLPPAQKGPAFVLGTWFRYLLYSL